MSPNPESARGLIDGERYDAALFDLDGVLTDTARIHAGCWKQLFDEFLEARAEQLGEAFEPFDLDTDYRLHVDGKPRIDGTRDFLVSRRIEVPEGDADDPIERDTIIGLSLRKDSYFATILRRDGIEAYPGSVKLVRHLREVGIKMGVVSSSHNCEEVLEIAKIADAFDTRVDGVVIDEAGMKGKPAPDSFLEAARRLGVSPERAVVLEDALSGVEAGRAGGFGLVVGVSRKDDAEALAKQGADVVVLDLAELLP